MAIDRIAALDIPADLDELRRREQRECFRAFLRDFAALSSKTPTILRPGFLENLPTLRQQFPAITVEEMRAMAEQAFEPDTEFVPGPDFDNGPLMEPPPADEMSPRIPRASPSAASPPQPSAAPRPPRSEGCS